MIIMKIIKNLKKKRFQIRTWRKKKRKLKK
jgi:hypothetical protein